MVPMSRALLCLVVFDSLLPGRYGGDSKSLILTLNIQNSSFSTCCELALRWMPQNLTDDFSTWVQVMAWCCQAMMTSSNGNIFRVTGHLCGNSPVPGEFPSQRPVTQRFDVFFHLCVNKRLSKQS